MTQQLVRYTLLALGVAGTLCLSLVGVGCSSSDEPVYAAAGAAVAVAGAPGSGAGGSAAGASSGGASAGAPAAGSAAAGAPSAGTGGGVAGASAGAGAAGASAGAGGSAGSAGSGVAGSAAVDHDAPGVIVVLGSSTAAGTGPTKPENAWVERYRAYLKQQFPKFQLINLAVGGYTTFQMQPSDYKPPANRPAPDPNHNITKALTSNPNAIIINMPTNDQASKFPLAEQLANYDRVTALGTPRGVVFWVTTTQPRNFADAAQRNDLILARDAIKQKFGTHTLDFWTQFAEADGKIKAMYDAGDGTHMNDAAHALLVEQVIQAEIPEAILSAKH